MNIGKSSIPLCLISAAAGAGLMWLLGPSEPPPSSSAASPGKTRPVATPTAARAGAPAEKTNVNGDPAAENLLAAARPGVVNAKLLSAFETILADPAPARRARRFISLLGAMRAEDAEAVRGLFRQGDIEGRGYEAEWNAFWPRWGEVDGRAALQSLTDLAATGADLSWLNGTAGLAMESWAGSDPAAAEAWLAGKSPEEAVAWGLFQFARGLGARDLEAATRFISDPARPPEYKARLFEQVAEAAKASGGGAGVVKWFESMPDEASRIAAFEHVVWRQFKQDPAAAQALVDRYRDLPWPNQNKVLPNLVSELANTDPAGATQWAAGLPRSEIDAGAVNAVTAGFDRWIDADPAAAAAWLSAHQEEPYYDIAAYNTARKLIRKNDPAAQAWMDSIGNPQMKESLQRIAEQQTTAPAR